jgi:protein-L-isoaspartate(D-aspartate) O-methyltransferase
MDRRLAHHFAEEVMLCAGLQNRSIEEAFARVPREAFFGPGPWQVAMLDASNLSAYRYVQTADDRPQQLYHNVTLALDADQALVTALPSSVAQCLHELDIQPRQRVLHLGAGVGYYTAVLAELVGAGGQVWATEVHPELGRRALQALQSWPQVHAEVRIDLPEEAVELDAMFINTGVTHLEPDWLDRMAINARLLVPLTTSLTPQVSAGLWMLITRQADSWSARPGLPAYGYSGVGVRDAGMEVVLRQALSSGRIGQVRRVRRDAHDPQRSCILHRAGACLST